jgi:hypothetical protein
VLALISETGARGYEPHLHLEQAELASTVSAEDLDLSLHLEAIRMRGVLDSQPLWAKERGAIEQRYRLPTWAI